MTSSVFLTTALVVTGALLVPLVRAESTRRLDHRLLTSKVNEGVRWHWYWHRTSREMADLNHRHVRVKAVRFDDEWLFLISSLKIAIRTALGPDGQPGTTREVNEGEVFGSSNTIALEAYQSIHRSYSSSPSCLPGNVLIRRPGANPDQQRAGTVIPNARPCIPPLSNTILQEQDEIVELDLRWPAKEKGSPNLDVLLTAIQRWGEIYYPGLSAGLDVPIFSADDPIVYVYVRFKDKKARGILSLLQDGNQRVNHKFHENPGDVEHYRQRIDQRRLTRIDWSPQRPRSPARKPGNPGHVQISPSR